MIRVVLAGLHATVQDAGRTGSLRDGVPTAGPVDRVAHAFANALVGNDPADAALEVSGLPFAFVAERPLLVAATGREVRLTVRDAVPGWTCAFVRAGDEVRIDGRSRYAYVAFSGGVDAAIVLGSRASYPAAGLGAAPLRAGSRVGVRAARVDAARAGLAATTPVYGEEVRVLVGPHADKVDLAAFLAARFYLDERSDRMAARLRGATIGTRGGELLTTGVVEGAVQVPPGGEPIVLLADHQTTGGYPVVATVIAADLGRVAQRSPGEALRFVATSERAAVDALAGVRREVFAVRDARSA